LGSAEFNHFRLNDTIKYNLNRLNELGLITKEEQAQLGQLADHLEPKSDFSALAQSIQGKENVSPLATALVGIANSVSPETAGATLSGAIVGALIEFGWSKADLERRSKCLGASSYQCSGSDRRRRRDLD
jgi:hypothetical protein